LSGISPNQTGQNPTPFIKAVPGSFVLDACEAVSFHGLTIGWAVAW